MTRRLSVRGLFFVLAASAACNSECSGGAAPSPIVEGGSIDSATRTTSLDAATPALDPLCVALLGQEGLDAGALQNEDRTSLAPRMHCVGNGRVAWAVRVDALDAGRSVRQTLLFAGAEGAHAKDESTLVDVEWPPSLGRHSALFDFDGDGVPEFFSTVPKDIKTFEPASRILVGYKGGKISPYPTPSGWLVDGVSDLDADGRGDLALSVELGKRTVCTPGDEGAIKVTASAHGLPGGAFSLTDATAGAADARKCPSMPAATEMFVPSMDRVDPKDLSLSWVSCSRLRGKSDAAVIAELQAACAPNAAATAKCSGPCRHLPDAIAVARFPPPLQLKDAPDH